jgi:lipid II:glycine glycyltransferase (peptidoglycan interpeptide bridge formation enzyme)
MRRIAPLEARHRAAWDALTADHHGAGFMQSWAWSRFKELEGYTVVRLGIFEGATLRGGAVAYAFPSPAEGGLVAVPDGPVLDWETPGAAAAFRALLEALLASAAGKRAVAVRVEPRLEAVPAPLGGLARAPVDLVPEETLEVDLGPDAVMLARMKPKGRYNARLAGRRGVEVVSSTDPADVHEFYRVLAETARYHGFLLEPKSFFINLVQALCPEMGRLAFARYKGMTLAAALTVRHGGTVTFLYGGHLPLFPDVMASYALHWHILREAAREGYRIYDFYGYVAPGRPDHPYDRFSRFKEKFGGRHVRRIGSRDVVFYDRLADVALRALRRTPAAGRPPAARPVAAVGGRPAGGEGA